MAEVGGLPGLSQLLAWPADHLTEAADNWETVGARCYELASQVWQDALTIDWQGEAADALRADTHADMMTTSAVTDQLQSAAKAARSAASDLSTARSRVRYAVQDAHTSGFDVSESLSVTDRSNGGSTAQRAARQAQAQALAADIGQRAAQLVALDEQVAGRVTAAVAGIGQTFPPSPSPYVTQASGKVQAVDHHTFKEDPPPTPPPGKPFAGWSEAQKAQVATEIANGHAIDHFPGMKPPELARSIYDAMNDPSTRVGSSTKSGGLTLLKSDGTVIFINPKDGDFGTAFVPKPRPGVDSWRTPLEYFEQNTRAVEPIPPRPPDGFRLLVPGRWRRKPPHQSNRRRPRPSQRPYLKAAKAQG
jgi:hypothetical protein